MAVCEQPILPASFVTQVAQRVRAAAAALARAQGADGFWRDYELQPGPSEAWTTAFVGWCLAHLSQVQGVKDALARSLSAIRRAAMSGGWGYNRKTGPDADSTAWALLFIGALGGTLPRNAAKTLTAYLDAAGNAHTFREPMAGSWGDGHLEVTPVVGLALHTLKPDSERLEHVRARVAEGLERCNSVAFWWNSDTYGLAFGAQFLAITGGIPFSTRTAICARYVGCEAPTNVFERALRVLLLTVLGSYAEHACQLVSDLLDGSDNDSFWPSSPVLRVPARFPSSVEDTSAAHADQNRYMTTAIVCCALARWLNWHQALPKCRIDH
jgi:hypothetical protein